MRTVEYRRWRYRDPQPRCIGRTMAALTGEEAASYPKAERIEGAVDLREVTEELRENTAVHSDESDAADVISPSRPQERC
jgi:hypothetical protein